MANDSHTTKRKKPKTYWAGFYDDHINAIHPHENHTTHYPAILTSKRHAQVFFNDVRKVRIVEVRS
jgi:hypothetical protein